ncbi:hypothetical protein PHYBOEH_005062 [Phytophthora boehmeriae]|uniref:RxLR effector protein n=1 Tax=Phytophthora boehmeriae TaxID=109152 RepID=A0A8T1WRZ0_9STRA|nr:hypothetical protein PHYBOEH_005062 [Phytophthora boehmeriae]
MRLQNIMLIAVTILLSVATATDSEIAKVASTDSSVVNRLLDADQHKRFLRVENTADEDDEERAISTGALGKAVNKLSSTVKESNLVSKARYKYWLKRGETPITIFEKLGMKGLTTLEQKKHPNFRHYLAFSKLWRDKKGLFSVK